MLKKLTIEQFKGIRFLQHEYLNNITVVSGRNGTGKTTTADAHFWLWADKDYDLQSNPEVHPDFMAESEPSVTEVHEIDGKTVTFRKYQTDMRTKKQKEDGAPIRIANKYEVNSVPKTQKDFIKAAQEYGIDTDNFLMFSHPNELLGRKVADRRNVIFGLAGDVTDMDVAEIVPECAEARELLKSYKSDEIVAMQKATVKRCKENIDSIPQQIIGMERAKVTADPKLHERQTELKQSISAKTAERDSYLDRSHTEAYDMQLRQFDMDKQEAYNKANTERLVALNEAQRAVDDARAAFTRAKQELQQISSTGQNINNGYRSQSETLKRLQMCYQQEKDREFSTNTTCPTCGQAIPEAQIETARQNWREQHDNTLKSFADQMRACQTQLDSYMSEGKELAVKKKAAEQAIKEASDALSDAEFEVTKYSDPIQPDVSEIDAKIESVKANRQKVAECASKANEIGIEINALKQELANVTKAIMQESNNARIDAEIEVLKNSLSEYVQSKADAENVLYQMGLISQQKNELLSDMVNNNFTRVKWRLFDIQKNGEIKDDCTPLVLCSDGKYRDMTYSANTAAIQAAKLDICRGLQKHYGQDLPIFLDGAECFDEANRAALESMDAQLILLCVSEDEGLVVK